MILKTLESKMLRRTLLILMTLINLASTRIPNFLGIPKATNLIIRLT